MLVGGANGPFSQNEARKVQSAARTLGLRLLPFNVTTDSELMAAFATLVEQRAGAVLVEQGNRVRRIGVLWPGDENDLVTKTNVSAFTQALADLGWTEGRNVRMDLRYAGGDINRIRALAAELVGLQPDIMLTTTKLLCMIVPLETNTAIAL
jgi:ABC-type uncharacterized transport system substrate-binding protein